MGPLGHADLDEAVLAAGDSALDEHEVLLSVDANELEVADGDALVAHVAVHVQALADAGGIGALTDGTRLALVAAAVGHGAAGEVPALDGALEALALGGAGDVDGLDVGEISDGDDVAALVLLAVLDANLAEEAHRLDAGLGEVARHRLVHVLGSDVSEADLDGVVAVGRLRLHLRDGAGAGLDDGDGDDVVVLIPHLRHTELAAKDRADHAHSLPSVVVGQCEAPFASTPEDHVLYLLLCRETAYTRNSAACLLYMQTGCFTISI